MWHVNAGNLRRWGPERPGIRIMYYTNSVHVEGVRVAFLLWYLASILLANSSSSGARPIKSVGSSMSASAIATARQVSHRRRKLASESATAGRGTAHLQIYLSTQLREDMGSSNDIRFAQPDDAADMLEILRADQLTRCGKRDLDQQHRQGLKQMLEDITSGISVDRPFPRPSHCLVLPGAGFCAYRRYHPNGPGFYISMLMVSPDHRRKGVGTSLVKHLLRTVSRDECADVHLSAVDAEAMEFWSTFGFKAHGEGHRGICGTWMCRGAQDGEAVNGMMSGGDSVVTQKAAWDGWLRSHGNQEMESSRPLMPPPPPPPPLAPIYAQAPRGMWP